MDLQLRQFNPFTTLSRNNADQLNSKAQYERQFRHWGFKKNRPTREWKDIGYVLAKRKRDGKESDVYDYGVVIPKTKVQKEIGRHSFPASELLEMKYNSGTLSLSK